MKNKQQAVSARNIANHIVSLGGPDLRHMSDDELIKHLTTAASKMADAVTKTGISAHEAHEALKKFSNIHTSKNNNLPA